MDGNNNKSEKRKNKAIHPLAIVYIAYNHCWIDGLSFTLVLLIIKLIISVAHLLTVLWKTILRAV
jgi:hypothetical protein